ncbi:MAG: hypothetical protein H7281_09935 [Bacteriovorax sp.]|nr:hypothetical protein [Bacteriovorax sp.]
MRISLTLLLLSCTAFSAFGAQTSKLKLDTGIEIFTSNTTDPSALAVNDDGSRIYWIAKKSKKSLLEPIDVFYSTTDINNVNPIRIKRGFGDLYTAVSPIVGTEDDVVVNHENYTVGAIIRTVLHKLITKDDTPKGYKSCIDIRNVKTNKSVKNLCAVDLGLKQELLAHARVSPDKNWLTFYLKGEKNPAGIYLFNMNTGKTVLLGEFNDKHPTWSTDGSKIMFHFQRGGNTKSEADTEEAFIGWYDLGLNNDSIVTSSRHLIDDPALTTTFTYQKHPTMVPGTNFIIYHGQEKVDGSKKLYLRELKTDSKIRELSMKLNDCSIKSTKHASAGFHDHFVYFVGKTECKEGTEDVKSDSKIFRIDINTFIGKLK